MSKSEPFTQYLVPILDGIKSLDEYICQVSLVYHPSLVYSKNNIKAAQTGGGFNVIQLLSFLIFHKTNVFAGDAR